MHLTLEASLTLQRPGRALDVQRGTDVSSHHSPTSMWPICLVAHNYYTSNYLELLGLTGLGICEGNVSIPRFGVLGLSKNHAFPPIGDIMFTSGHNVWRKSDRFYPLKKPPPRGMSKQRSHRSFTVVHPGIQCVVGNYPHR